MESKNTQRFTNTVDYYTKYRPTYPEEVIQLLEKKCDFDKDKIIADVGSGTGIFTELLLQRGNKVFAVEPNVAMRHAAEKWLQKYSRFVSVNGTAEITTLANQSIDLITVAQAFHWFDQQAVKKEFLRILRPENTVLLVWNLRDKNASPFMQAYEQLMLEFGKDYQRVAAENFAEKQIEDFFYPEKANVEIFSNEQMFDWQGFLGRTLSVSYMPKPGDADCEAMVRRAKQVFDGCNEDGQVRFVYQTKCYYARL